jgi:hypothetical protein
MQHRLPPCHLLRWCLRPPRLRRGQEPAHHRPHCLPALFILAGAKPGEGCIIERTEDAAAIVTAPASIANDWLTPAFGRGTPRGYDSPTRQCLIAACQAGACDELEWLQPPIANPFTRLAAVLEPAAGRLTLQGWERPGAATQILHLQARIEALRPLRVSEVPNPCKVMLLKSLGDFLMHGVVLQNRMLRPARPLTTQRSPL